MPILIILFQFPIIIVNVQGISYFNCFYSSTDKSTLPCLNLLKNHTNIVDCSRDGEVTSYYGQTFDLHDKCSVTLGSHDQMGIILIRTCSRGKDGCDTRKERNHEILTNDEELIKIFLLEATYCVCEGDLCNNFHPTAERQLSLSDSNQNSSPSSENSKSIIILFLGGILLNGLK
ncbi:unnamed protein product [Allacma fusca]|uniref:Uncharacterized protein n=1 Tax=Allacma fusca TaxID=39272 RepID=A0A8J2KI55_9HEXA|nr:unnamed protein product [Allacma fusca]